MLTKISLQKSFDRSVDCLRLVVQLLIVPWKFCVHCVIEIGSLTLPGVRVGVEGVDSRGHVVVWADLTVKKNDLENFVLALICSTRGSFRSCSHFIGTVLTTALHRNPLKQCLFFSESLNFAHDFLSISVERGCKKRTCLGQIILQKKITHLLELWQNFWKSQHASLEQIVSWTWTVLTSGLKLCLKLTDRRFSCNLHIDLVHQRELERR